MSTFLFPSYEDYAHWAFLNNEDFVQRLLKAKKDLPRIVAEAAVANAVTYNGKKQRFQKFLSEQKMSAAIHSIAKRRLPDEIKKLQKRRAIEDSQAREDIVLHTRDKSGLKAVLMKVFKKLPKKQLQCIRQTFLAKQGSSLTCGARRHLANFRKTLRQAVEKSFPDSYGRMIRGKAKKNQALDKDSETALLTLLGQDN